MPKKNLFLFFALSLAAIVGWGYLQSRIWPPPERKLPPPPEWLWGSYPPAAQAEVLTRVLAAPASPGPGLDAAARMAVLIAALDSEPERMRLATSAEPKPAAPEKEPDPVLAGASAVAAPESTRPFGALAALVAGKVEIRAPLAVSGASHRTVTLGGDGFNLQVVLTSKGAGVQELILTRFQEASKLGRPVWQDAKKRIPEPLHLIPDNGGPASNVLLDYPNPAMKHPEHPLGRLGELEWRFVEQGPAGQDEEGVQRAAFTTGDFLRDFKITKTFTLRPKDYHLGLTVEVERRGPKADTALPFRYQLTGPYAMPIEGEWYTYVYRNALMGVVDSSGRVDRVLEDSRTIAFQEGGNEVVRPEKAFIRYAGIATQYFASVIAVDNKQEAGTGQDFLAWARPTLETRGRGHPDRPWLDDVTVRVVSEPVSLKPGERIVHKYLLYNGPVKVSLLDDLANVDVDQVIRYHAALSLNTLTDYHSPGGMGRFSSSIGWTALIIKCTNFMHWLLWHLLNIIRSYGLSIIVLTVLVRGAMFPLSRKQAIASARMQAKMAELAPEVKKLEERYKDDPMQLQQEKHQLYLRRGVNPLAMMGSCWIVFLQMPIFLGLYYALQESIHFRLAPFLWMENLAAPDMLVEWGQNIPILSTYLGPFLNLLPIIAVVLMVVQQQMLTPPPQDEQQAMQQKMMKYMMIFFGLMFYKVAAGLCMYFIASSAWGLTERKLLPKRQTGAAAVAPAAAARPTSPARARRPQDRDTGDGNWWERVLRDAKEKWEKVLKEAKKK